MSLSWVFLTMKACKQHDLDYNPAEVIHGQYAPTHVALLKAFNKMPSTMREVDFLLQWVNDTGDVKAFALMFDGLLVRQNMMHDFKAKQ